MVAGGRVALRRAHHPHELGDDVVAELVRMMGAAQSDSAAGDHARELLRTA